MTRKVDPEVLAGFLEEARSYMPQIRHGLDSFRASPSGEEVLAEVYRLAHCIRGAAAMLDLAGLSHIANQLEETIEDVARHRLELSGEVDSALRRTVDAIETYLDGIAVGTLHEQALVEEVTRLHRGLRGLPVEEHLNTLRDVLAQATPFAFRETPARETPVAPQQEAGRVPPEVSADEAEDVSPELLEVFALEAEEHLRNISSVLPALEARPGSKELIQSIRRSAHTLKGAAAMVGFRKITQLAHRMEDVLDLLYDDQLAVTPQILSVLLKSSDALQDLAAGKGEEAALQELYARYAEILSADVSRSASATPDVAVEEDIADAKRKQQAARRAGQFVRVPLQRLDELVKLVSELVIARIAFEQRMGGYVRQREELGLSVERLRRVSSKLQTEYEARALGSTRLSFAGAASWSDNHGFDDLELDRYTGFHLLSRELAETTADIHTVSAELGALHGDFDSYLNRQSRLSSELQDKLMRIRMVPLATLAAQLHRTVRNVAAQQGKQVSLLLEGEQTELDKTVLEEISEPLLHLLRNAVDHGIEPPALRQLRGKPARGAVQVRAFYEGTQVVIQVKDDGAGIEPEIVRSAAVAGGFVPASAAAELAGEDLLGLLFLPGFSTAAKVSEISGRGVGLDIVKAKVQKLKGTVSLQSTPGQGTTCTIRLPLTLAITRALLVKAHGQTFALPLAGVLQILRLEEDVERVGQEAVVRVAGKVYPVVTLSKALGLQRPAPRGGRGLDEGDEAVKRPPMVLLNAGDRQVALVVDRLLGGREIVVKTLGTHVRRLRGVTGATLMGDGSVVLILNPAELLGETRTATAHAPARPLSRPSPPRGERGPAEGREALTVMVVDDSPSVRRVVSNLIATAGWTPVPARDGLDALEILHRSAVLPDVLLLDIEMPRMDGYELLATLRGQAPYRGIPVVMITSRAGEKHRRKALDLGASGYLVKPYQDEVLLATVRRLVQEAHGSCQLSEH